MKDDKKLEAPSKKRVPIKFRKGEDDGTGRLAMEDAYASGYKLKSYVDPETGETKNRKIRAHRINFKNSGMDAKPEITKEEKMKKTFSQFKEEYGLDEAKFAKGGIPSAPNTGNKDDGYTKRQRQRAAKKRAEELTKQRREREMKEELNLEDFSLEEIEEFMMSEEFEQLDELSKSTIASYAKKAESDRHERINKDVDLGSAGYALRNLKAKKNSAYSSAGPSQGAGETLAKHHPDLHKQIGDIFNTLQARRKQEMKKVGDRERGMQRANARLNKEQLNLEDFSLEEIEDFMMSEDFEQLDELSKATLASYRDKANKQIDRGLMRSRDIRGDKTAMKRMRNIGKAQKRLANEELDLDEAAWPKSFDRSRRTGDETATSHSVSKTATGTKYSKMFDPDGISKGTGDDAAKAVEGVKRGRGRPRKNPLPSGHQAAADLQGLMGSKLPKKASKLPSTKHSMGEALEVLFDLDEETFNHMMEEYGLDASIEIIQNELEEGLQDDILAIAKKVSPNARVRPSVEQQKADRDEMIRKRMAAAKDKKQAPYKPHEKYPLGGHDPVSNRSYSD